MPLDLDPRNDDIAFAMMTVILLASILVVVSVLAYGISFVPV